MTQKGKVGKISSFKDNLYSYNGTGVGKEKTDTMRYRCRAKIQATYLSLPPFSHSS